MAGAELYYSRSYCSVYFRWSPGDGWSRALLLQVILFSLFQVVARGWLEQSSTTPGHTVQFISGGRQGMAGAELYYSRSYCSVYFRWSPGDGWSRALLLQ